MGVGGTGSGAAAGAGYASGGPINGPGMCGADFPLKVAALGDHPLLSYADEPLRPPGEDWDGSWRLEQK